MLHNFYMDPVLIVGGINPQNLQKTSKRPDCRLGITSTRQDIHVGLGRNRHDLGEWPSETDWFNNSKVWRKKNSGPWKNRQWLKSSSFNFAGMGWWKYFEHKGDVPDVFLPSQPHHLSPKLRLQLGWISGGSVGTCVLSPVPTKT